MKNYELGQKTKNVTITPNFALKLIGRLDARKGVGVAEAHLRRYLDKCESIENEECLTAESFLKTTRNEGAQQLAIISKQSKMIPTMPGSVEETHTWDVLENRRRSQAINNAHSAVENARARLYEINEKIVNGGTILDERISRIRKRAGAKMDAYLKGLRAGGLHDFEPGINYSDKPKTLYYERHKRLDKAIEAAAIIPEFEEVI